MPEYAVGFLSKPNFGAPFAPLTKERALEVLPSLRRKWPDATLLIRTEDKHPEWRRATTAEGGQ